MTHGPACETWFECHVTHHEEVYENIKKKAKCGCHRCGEYPGRQHSEYSVQVKVGSDNIPVIFDTGSSDLWSISTDCTRSSCGAILGTPQISPSSLKASGLDMEIDYGDSAHSTSASGPIVSGPVSIAGLQINDQFIGAVNTTDTDLTDENISGIFGAGFPNPASSVIFTSLLEKSLGGTSLRSNGAAITDAFISGLATQGPLLSRLANSGQLKQPMFTVTLQRETVEIGGNVGQLTIGQLPDGVSNDSLTWVPVRLYSEAQGGLASSTSNPNELYPARWEVPLDDVLLNGQTLPKPALDAGIGYSALIDSGTSFLAGPKTVVNNIYSAISTSSTSSRSSSNDGPAISCSTPVKMAFVIGGKQFPLDPRDFLGQQTSVQQCTAGTLLPTDAPSTGGLMSWILGDPFMKSNLVAFYYGNLTHPSVDPPRMGFLSTVPSDADSLYTAAVKSAVANGEFIVSSVEAPTATFPAAATNSAGVAQAAASGSSSPKKKNGGVVRYRTPWTFLVTAGSVCAVSALFRTWM